MFNSYILKHAAATLHTLVREYLLEAIPHCKSYDLIVDFSDQPFGTAVMDRSALLMEDRSHLILSIAGAFSYALLKDGGCFVLIGPLRFQTPVFVQKTLTLADLKIATPLAQLEDWIRSVPVVDFQETLSALLLLINVSKKGTPEDPYLEKADLIKANCVNQVLIDKIDEKLSKTIFENVEDGRVHNPFNHEIRERNAIAQGDVAALRTVLSEDFTGRYGVLASNPLRQEIDIGIVAVTIASRAAISGGVHFETAFYLSDITIQSMEKCTDVETVKQICQNTEFKYASMVRDLKLPQGSLPEDLENKHISHCKDYIYTHLHGKIMVSEIASAIGLNVNYLSTLFKKSEHISLKEYIMKAKINLVKNLLTYSNYSFAAIAAYLGFSSQSHMDREFKKYTGQTPRKYREQNYSEDFIRDSLDE
jgi:AraC-like DNA-binding protein